MTARQRGQATVELALGLPLVLLGVLLVVQVGLVVADQVRVVHAAREGVRAAAVDDRDRCAARRAALARGRAHAGPHRRWRSATVARPARPCGWPSPTGRPPTCPSPARSSPTSPSDARATMRVEG